MVLAVKECEQSLLCPLYTGRGHTWWEENLPIMKGHNAIITDRGCQDPTHNRILFAWGDVLARVLGSMRFSRQEHWSGLLFPSPGDLPDPRIEPMSPVSPALLADYLPTEPLWKPQLETPDQKDVHICCCCSVTKSWPTLFDPMTVAHQAPLSFTISCSLLRFMSIELVMLSNHFILYHHLLLLPLTFPSIRVFSNEWALSSGSQSIGTLALASVLLMNI